MQRRVLISILGRTVDLAVVQSFNLNVIMGEKKDFLHNILFF